MYDQPDEWLDLVRRGHTMIETCEVLDFDGTSLMELDLASGDVTEDAGAEVRHNVSVDIVDPIGELTPVDLDDLLMPTGRRIRVSRGIVGTTGDMVPLATVFLTETRARLDGEGRATVPLTGYDRAIRLQRPTSRPLAIPAGRSTPLAIRDLLLTVDPTLTADVMTSAGTTPRLVFESDTDLYAQAGDLAATIGGELYVSRDDVLTLRPVPLITPFTPAVWRITEEVDPPERTSTAITAETVIATDRIPNGIIVVGQHSSMTAPVRGEAWDMRPTSPTYRHGPYGDYPRFVSTEKATTIAAANAMATAILQTVNTATEVDVEVFPPPYHLVAGDIVWADLPTVGASGRYILWSMSTPLADPGGSAQITLRRSITEDA
ncbi:MAG TPA: hypothetical protein VHK88_19915 [Aquihabitans sp.]|nr:hypothetical protein [Aquihabitans sp.]